MTDVLELLVKATYAREGKAELLRAVKEGIETMRRTVKLCIDRRLLSLEPFKFSAGCLDECDRMVGGSRKQARG